MYCEKCGSILMDGECPNCKGDLTRKKGDNRNRNMAIFAVILSVLSIGLLAIGFSVLSSPKTIVLQSVSNWGSLLKSGFKSNDTSITKKIMEHHQIQLEESLSLEIDPILNLGFEKANFKIDYRDDRQLKKSKIDFGMFLDQNELNLDAFIASDKFTFKIKDVLEKYYYFDFSYVSFFKDVETIDSKRMIDIIIDSLKDGIEEKDLKKSKATILLGDDAKKTNKISYEVTSKKLVQMVIDILEKIKKDKELILSISDFYDQEELLILVQIDQMIQLLEAEKNQKSETLFYYNVYYYGFNNIVMEEFSLDDTALQYYHYGEVHEIKLVDVKSKTNYFTMKMKKEKESVAISGFILTYEYHGVFEKNDRSTLLKMDFDFGEKGVIHLEFTESIKEENDIYQSQFDMTAYGNLVDIDLGNGVKISSNLQYTFDQEVDIPEIDDAINVNEMTEEEQFQFFDSLHNHPFLSPIIDFVFLDFNSLMTGDSNFYSSDV